MARSQAVSTAQVASSPSANNPIINGAFDIWQRGTSFSFAASTAYTAGFIADRWQTATNANQACTVSRQVTNDTTNLPNIQYCLRYQRNSGQTGTGTLFLVQNFESVNSIPFAGKTITFSFYARAGANYSQSNSRLGVVVQSGTGTDQNAFAGFTGFNSFISTSATTLTTTWQRFSYTGTMPTTGTELNARFEFTPSGTAGTNDYYEVTGIQIDVGSVALPFRRSGGTIQGELAACQRYYVRWNTSDNAIANAAYWSTTDTYGVLVLPVEMRVTPTGARSGTGALRVQSNSGNATSTAVTFANGSTKSIRISAVTTAKTAGHAAWYELIDSNAWIEMSAEL